MSTTRSNKVHIAGRTPGQNDFLDAIQVNTVTFGLGPAGTGKTYLSVASAVKALRQKEVERIIITRPVVEAGEKLGFLPGDLNAKMDPYLRPIFDSFRAWMPPEEMHNLIELGIIEIAPLAFMRGRTLSKAFIILDEAQNTTPAQMFMMLTRLGSGSKMVINGDWTQIDLPGGKARSGLYAAEQTLAYENLAHVRFCSLGQSDIVRHPVVKSIVESYEKRAKIEEERLLQIEMEPFVSMNGNGQH